MMLVYGGPNPLIVILILAHVRICLSVRCYSCDNVALPEECVTIATCAANQECYSRRFFGATGNEYYESGCVAKSTCDSLSVSTNPLGRKREMPRDTPGTCYDCCAGDFCNMRLCSSAAADTNRRCLQCHNILSPYDCNTVTECGTDQQCIVRYAPYHSTHHYSFEMGCSSNIVCTALSQVSSTNTMCVRCCDDQDMCNMKACDDWLLQHQFMTTHKTASQTTTRKPTTTLPPPPQIIFLGTVHANYEHSLSIQCYTGGSSISGLQWYRHSRDPLPPGVSVVGGNTLHIPSLDELVAGRYTCQVTTPYGQTVEQSTTVTIDSTPPQVVSVSKEPGHVTSDGVKVILTCYSKGYPKPYITWQFFDAADQHTAPLNVMASPNMDVLTIPHFVTSLHAGRWICIATNSVGSSQQQIMLP